MSFELRVVSPSFDAVLTNVVLELNKLRDRRLHGSTRPVIFFELKSIFHILESVGSARIEGNRTTISEYMEKKIENKARDSERFSEIANVEDAMNFIDRSIDKGTEITHHFVRELHSLVVGDLNREGDRTPGAYRTWNVDITLSDHTPPDHIQVQSYMDELLEFINKEDDDKYDLLKAALAHHRFTWVHPFGNGNGRVVRLLTYAMLIKYGFNIKAGQILNPTAVFCSDREAYYRNLSIADTGDDESLLIWSEYVLNGILDEIRKIDRLLDFKFLLNQILKPTITHAIERKYLNKDEAKVVNYGIENQIFKSGDLSNVLPELTSRQRSHLISIMRKEGFIKPIAINSRSYYVSFMNNYLMRSLVLTLEEKKFIPSIE